MEGDEERESSVGGDVLLNNIVQNILMKELSGCHLQI